MTLAELKNKLDAAIGASKVAYRMFPEGEAPQMPFAVYYSTGADNFGADGSVYHSSNAITIELYSKYKDTATEAKIEEALNGIYYSKSETYIDTEQCTEIIYEMEI